MSGMLPGQEQCANMNENDDIVTIHKKAIMIKAASLRKLISYDVTSLTELLARSGYSHIKLVSAVFVGITNGHEYAYMVVMPDSSAKDKERVAKVYLHYDHIDDKITASM